MLRLLGVADDELRAISGLAQDIGARADADQNWLILLDERLEPLEVVGGIFLFGHHDDVAAAQFDVDVGDADAVDQQRALATDELNGVACEGFQMGDQPALGFLHELGDLFLGALGAANQSTVTDVHAAVVEADFRAVFDLLEDIGAGLVDESDAVGQQHLGAEVGIAARHRRRRVDDGGDLGVDERVGGDPVQIQHVEHRDVTGAYPAQQPVDVAVDPGGPDDTRPRGIAGQQ